MRLPEGLLEQAQHLARREPKRPKQASLRRAISTAYYALFHLLISEAILSWKRVEDRDDLARMFEHTNRKTVCANKRDELNGEFKKMKKTASPAHELTVKKHLHLVAETFVQMHQQRESADYDYSTAWARTDVVAKVATVDAAFKCWKAIRKEDIAQAFLFTLLQKETSMKAHLQKRSPKHGAGLREKPIASRSGTVSLLRVAQLPDGA